MPTLLQINVTANWGSTGKIAELIGEKAVEHGWDSYIAFGRYSTASKSQLIKIGSKLDPYIHYASQRIFDNEGLCSGSATRHLISQIESIKPDIVHLHNIHDHYLNYRLLFEYLNTTDMKVVWTCHDFWTITGHCMHFVSANCERYKTGCFDCPMRNVYPKSLVDKSSRNYKLKKQLFSANKNLTLVGVSNWVADRLRDSFLKDKLIHVIPNGIDLTVFKPTTSYEDKFDFVGKFVILSVASQWKFDKGLNDYLNMSKLLKDDEIIVLVGVDDGIIASLPKNIIGIKKTSEPIELAALYTRADVLTVLSSAETFGLTVVEANACGTPAVVYNNTAPPALITPETGFVVENSNYIFAYDAISRIKKIGKARFSKACIGHAHKNFDKNACANKYLNLYENLLSTAQQ